MYVYCLVRAEQKVEIMLLNAYGFVKSSCTNIEKCINIT